jgi:hypothetical protein
VGFIWEREFLVTFNCLNSRGPESLFYESSDPEPVKEILEDTSKLTAQLSQGLF